MLRRSLLLLAAAAPLADAQSRAALVGSVRDSAGSPLSLAQLSVGAARTVTDTAGRFMLTGLAAGVASVTARRLGFSPVNMKVELAEGRTDSVHIVLAELPAHLPGLAADVEARERMLLADFYRHRETGHGYFLNRRQLDSTRVRRISDLMRRIPGVRILVDRNGRLQLRMSRSESCPPDLWIDGQRAAQLNVDDVPMVDVEAIEVYRGPSGLPPEYNVRFGNPGCGAIVIWTRLPG
jgi:hypothetical protein